MAQTSGEHSLISPTAKLVAYWRQFSDIPYATEVARYAEVDKVVTAYFGEQGNAAMQQEWAIPYVEARYKCIMQAVDRAGITQVLELASGLSLRGLATTQSRTEIQYVETDLAGMHAEKVGVVHDILQRTGQSLPPNLHLCAANALSYTELEEAVRHLDPQKPLAIVNEGLCMYLPHPEKRQLAINIRQLLRKFGGVWLTPDLDSKEATKHHHWAQEDAKKMADAIAQHTKRHFDDCTFASDAEMMSFFAELGFIVTSSPMIDDTLALSTLHDRAAARQKLMADSAFMRLWRLKLT